LGLCSGCVPSIEQRIECAQQKFNTSEVISINNNGRQDLLVRDQSNQVWRVYIDDNLIVNSAIILFPAEKGKPPSFVQNPQWLVEPNFEVK
jgi:hypothetical protein